MRKFLFGLLLIFCISSILFAQSGRRIKTKATPKPTKIVKPEDEYSESRSYKPRRIYPPNYRKKKKKETTPKPEKTPTDVEEDIITVESTLVTIPVSVYDRNGLYIPSIQKEEFKIFEDGVEQEIAYFGTSEKPFTVAILLDTSPSTEYQIEDIRRGAKAFVDQLKPQDKVLVITFDRSVKVLTKQVTNNRQKIYRAIDKASFGGGTALYDAVYVALKKRLSKIEGRKAVVLFTDGVDTVSGRSYDRTMELAEESEAIIYPIYYNTFLTNQGINGGVLGSPLPQIGGRSIGRGMTAEEYALGKRYLDELAAYTGGRVYVPTRTPGGLRRAFEGIAEELRRQYSLGYHPLKEGKPGERRKIKVRVYRPKLIVRARDSYVVGGNN